jgi:hypothetical protein
MQTLAFCVLPHAVEQDRLSDPSKPDEEKAPGWAAPANSLQGDTDLLTQLVAPRKLRGLRSGSRRVRIPDGIHAAFIGSFSDLTTRDKLGKLRQTRKTFTPVTEGTGHR